MGFRPTLKESISAQTEGIVLNPLLFVHVQVRCHGERVLEAACAPAAGLLRAILLQTPIQNLQAMLRLPGLSGVLGAVPDPGGARRHQHDHPQR